LVRLLSPRLAHLKDGKFWKYPPYWGAVALAGAIVCTADLLVGLGPEGFSVSIWEWVVFAGGSVAIVVGYHLLATPSEPPPAAEPDNASLEELVRDWRRLERWLQREIAAEDDLLGNWQVAQRLANHLIQDGGTIGVVGPFGCGKTSIVKWIISAVERRNKSERRQVWVCVVSCWGFEDSASAIQATLTQAVQTVGRHVDFFSIRHLPESYRKTFSAGGDWVRNLSDLVIGISDQIEQFKSLSAILHAFNARLVIVVEDLDRTNTTRFDRQEVLALLQRLKELDGLSFILTGDATQANTGNLDNRIDFARLCDHIEVLREFQPRQVAMVVQAVRNRCLTAFREDINTHPANDDRWSEMGITVSYAVGTIAIPTALARLLRTPRGLKHTLRRTYQTWQRLHGEIDFDHLLLVNALRHGAPEAFDFLWQNWNPYDADPTRRGAASQQRNRVYRQLREEWERITEHAEWSRSVVEALIDFLLPENVLLHDADDFAGNRQMRSQGIGAREGRYWRRIVNEETEADQVRDQEVLHDMRDWYTSRNLDARLVEGLVRGADYAATWEHFAEQNDSWDGQTVLCFAGQVFARLRTDKTPRQLPDNPPDGFIVLWRRAHRIVQRNESCAEWLEAQIREAMPLSLQLVLDLYHNWASPISGIVGLEDREQIRRAVHESAQQRFQNGQALIRAAHPRQPYELYHLVFPPDQPEGRASILRGTEHWSWLGPFILDALRQQTHLFAPKVGYLISEHIQMQTPGTYIPRVVPERLQGMFGDQAEEVIRLLGEARDRLAGAEREFLDQVVRSAPLIDNTSHSTA
jgi:hypothetical protein